MVKFLTDAISVIGDMHVRTGRPNQDYAIATADADRAVAIVSDGCSSGRRTDIGARLVALAAERAYHGVDTVDIVPAARDILGLVQADLLATRMVATVEAEQVRITVHGDGIAAVGLADGGWHMVQVVWDGNIPFYPAYSLSEGDMAAFVAAHGGADARAVGMEQYRIIGGSEEISCDRHTVAEGIDGITLTYPTDAVMMVGVFSDGVASVPQRSWHAVVRDLMAFKTTAGAFLVRRVMRVVRDAVRQEGAPQDDLSGAVIIIDRQDAEVEYER